jgi:SNF2 family DNA or RNA helicase
VRLVTSAAGGVDLNLQITILVIIVCPEWLPAEEELIGHGYRIRQTKSVHVSGDSGIYESR